MATNAFTFGRAIGEKMAAEAAVAKGVARGIEQANRPEPVDPAAARREAIARTNAEAAKTMEAIRRRREAQPVPSMGPRLAPRPVQTPAPAPVNPAPVPVPAR